MYNNSFLCYRKNIFENARKFNQPIGGWDTSSATEVRYMFFGAIDYNNAKLGPYISDDWYHNSKWVYGY